MTKTSKWEVTFGDPQWLVVHALAAVLVAFSILSAFNPSWAHFSPTVQHYVLLVAPLAATALVLGHLLFTVGYDVVLYFEHKLSRQQLAADIEGQWPAMRTNLEQLASRASDIPTLRSMVEGANVNLNTVLKEFDALQTAVGAIPDKAAILKLVEDAVTGHFSALTAAVTAASKVSLPANSTIPDVAGRDLAGPPAAAPSVGNTPSGAAVPPLTDAPVGGQDPAAPAAAKEPAAAPATTPPATRGA
jgi:hypothetical protein